MHITKRLVAVFILSAILLIGCAPVKPTTSNVSELPEASIAKVEAKEALKEWQTLLENGQNLEFIQACMPNEVYEMSIDESGNLNPEVLAKLRAYAPKVVNALNEAQYIEPEIVGDAVVFKYNDIHTSGGFFKEDKIYLSKKNGRWFFNGPIVQNASSM